MRNTSPPSFQGLPSVATHLPPCVIASDWHTCQQEAEMLKDQLTFLWYHLVEQPLQQPQACVCVLFMLVALNATSNCTWRTNPTAHACWMAGQPLLQAGDVLTMWLCIDCHYAAFLQKPHNVNENPRNKMPGFWLQYRAHLCLLASIVPMIRPQSWHVVEPIDWDPWLYHLYQNLSDLPPLLALAICFYQTRICWWYWKQASMFPFADGNLDFLQRTKQIMSLILWWIAWFFRTDAMNLLSCSTLHNWCDDLGKHAIGTAGAVLTLLIHDLFRKHLPLVQLLQQSWRTKFQQASRLQAYHLPTQNRMWAAYKSWCSMVHEHHAFYVTQQLKMIERCTSHLFHRLSASSALPAFPNATRALQTLAGSKPVCRHDMTCHMPFICSCSMWLWEVMLAFRHCNFCQITTSP